MNASLRKQVQELSPHDFDAYPRWVYADDEEGVIGQNECTVRPLQTDEEPSTSEPVHVQAVFFFPNGRIRLGMLTLNAGDDPSGHQPSLYSPEGAVHFYRGAMEPAAKEAQAFTEMLRALSPTPYPIRYVSCLAAPNGRPLAYGELHGLYWLANWRTGELRVAA